jgi:trehalose 6-phosphate synthase/phosphatase
LGADLIGFHTDEYVQNFLAAAARVPGAVVRGERVHYRGRVVRVEAHPIGVDTAHFRMLAQDAAVRAEAEQIKRDVHSEFVLLGVDRLDYTKGVPERLLAFEHFLESYPEYRGRVTLFQISAPSRTRVESYQELKRSVDEIAGRINGSYMEGDWVPVRYLYRSHSQVELTSLYEAADVALVTPLRDGMNVVAQEFGCVTEKGVLMLSSLTGADAVLSGAGSVNPFDTEGVARALKEVLELPESERVARAGQLRARVSELDVHGWAERFLASLARA